MLVIKSPNRTIHKDHVYNTKSVEKS